MDSQLATTIGYVSLGLTAVMLVVSWFGLRKERPLRLRRDLLALVLSVLAIAVVALITPVVTRTEVAIGAGLVGLLLGLRRGMTLDVRVADGKALAKHGRAALITWGIGVLVTQAAAATVRTGFLRLGQAISVLGVASALGFILGRALPLRRARSGATVRTAAAASLAAMITGGVALGATVGTHVTQAPAAHAQDGPDYASIVGDWTAVIDLQDDIFDDDLGPGEQIIANVYQTTLRFSIASSGEVTSSATAEIHVEIDALHSDTSEPWPDHIDRDRWQGPASAAYSATVQGSEPPFQAEFQRGPIDHGVTHTRVANGAGHPAGDDTAFAAAFTEAFPSLALPDVFTLTLEDSRQDFTSPFSLDPSQVLPYAADLIGGAVSGEPLQGQTFDPSEDPFASPSAFDLASDDPSASPSPTPSASDDAGERDELGESPADEVDNALDRVLAPAGVKEPLEPEEGAAGAAAAAVVGIAAMGAAVGGAGAPVLDLDGGDKDRDGAVPPKPDGLPPKPEGPPPGAEVDTVTDPDPGAADAEGRLWVPPGPTSEGRFVDPAEYGAAMAQYEQEMSGYEEAIDGEFERLTAVDEAHRTRAGLALENALRGTGNDDLLAAVQSGRYTQAQLREVWDIMDRRTQEAQALADAGEPSDLQFLQDFWSGVHKTVGDSLWDTAMQSKDPMQVLIAGMANRPAMAVRMGLGAMTGGLSETVLAPADVQAAINRVNAEAIAKGTTPTFWDYASAGAWDQAPGVVLGVLIDFAPGVAERVRGMDPDELRRVAQRFHDGEESLESLAGRLRTMFAEGTESAAETAARAADGATSQVDEVADGFGRRARGDAPVDSPVQYGPEHRPVKVADPTASAEQVAADTAKLRNNVTHGGDTAVWTEAEKARHNRGLGDVADDLKVPASDVRPNLETPEHFGQQRGSVDPDEVASRLEQFNNTRAEAGGLIAELDEAAERLATARAGGDPDAIAQAQKVADDVALRLQENKIALQMANGDSVSNETRRVMRESMQSVYDKTDRVVLDKIAQQYNLKPPLRAVGTDANGVRVFEDVRGNQIQLAEPTNPVKGDRIKIDADRDFTVRMGLKGPDGSLVVKDVPRAQVKTVYEDAFFEAAGGKARFGDATPAEVAQRLDQMVTDAKFREAYGNNIDDLLKVIKDPSAELSPAQARQIGHTIALKGNHWFNHASASPEKYEQYMVEGFRQLTKQAENQVANRLGHVVGRPPAYLEEAIEIMKRPLASPGMPGSSPVEVEQALREIKMPGSDRAMGLRPHDVAQRLGDFYAGLHVKK